MGKNIFSLMLIGLFCFTACSNSDDYKVLKDFIISTPTYSSLDYDFAKNHFETLSGREFGGCSAIVKNIGTEDNKRIIVGRNMDLSYSNNSTYVIRTKEDGKHQTLGLSYSARDFFTNFSDFQKNHTLNEDTYKLLPFYREDVINDSGLYCELNMRNDEYYDDGTEKFGCDGTNKQSNQNVHMLTLPTYICSNCANIPEALEYVQTLNIYSNKNYWNFAYILADAEGNYGLLEIAQNKIFWQEGQDCQTNFYVEESLNEICEHKSGLGRYEYLQNHKNEITDIDSMRKVIDGVKFSNVYLGSKCPFDMRSEAYGLIDVPSFEHLIDDKNKEDVYSQIDRMCDEIAGLTKEEKIAIPYAWQTIFSTIADPNNKTLYVQFYEDENNRFELKI